MKNYHYEKYSRVIEAIARKIHNSTGLPLQDLIAEGNFAYARCMKYYKVKQGNFKAYFGASVYKAMKNYADDRLKMQEVELADTNTTANDNPEKNTIFKMMLETLSEEAKEVIQTVLETPRELIDFAKQEIGTTVVTMNVIRQYLFRKQNWKVHRIDSCFKEIRGVL